MPDLIREHTWQEGEHRRVLVEAAEWAAREQIASVLRDEGYETVTCPGPEGSGHRCSLAAGEGCPVAEQVDVVVHALRSSDPRNLEALRALRRRLPETPLVVEAPPAVLVRREAELDGCIVVEAPYRTPDLVEAVGGAMRTAPGRGR